MLDSVDARECNLKRSMHKKSLDTCKQAFSMKRCARGSLENIECKYVLIWPLMRRVAPDPDRALSLSLLHTSSLNCHSEPCCYSHN